MWSIQVVVGGSRGPGRGHPAGRLVDLEAKTTVNTTIRPIRHLLTYDKSHNEDQSLREVSLQLLSFSVFGEKSDSISHEF